MQSRHYPIRIDERTGGPRPMLQIQRYMSAGSLEPVAYNSYTPDSEAPTLRIEQTVVALDP